MWNFHFNIYLIHIRRERWESIVLLLSIICYEKIGNFLPLLLAYSTSTIYMPYFETQLATKFDKLKIHAGDPDAIAMIPRRMDVNYLDDRTSQDNFQLLNLL